MLGAICPNGLIYPVGAIDSQKRALRDSQSDIHFVLPFLMKDFLRKLIVAELTRVGSAKVLRR